MAGSQRPSGTLPSLTPPVMHFHHWHLSSTAWNCVSSYCFLCQKVEVVVVKYLFRKTDFREGHPALKANRKFLSPPGNQRRMEDRREMEIENEQEKRREGEIGEGREEGRARWGERVRFCCCTWSSKLSCLCSLGRKSLTKIASSLLMYVKQRKELRRN